MVINNENNSTGQSNDDIIKNNSTNENSAENMIICVSDGSDDITFELNNSEAARSLYD